MKPLRTFALSASLLLLVPIGVVRAADTGVDMRRVLDQLEEGRTAKAGASSFVGLAAEWYQGPGWYDNGYTGLWTMRLYAMFDGDDNGVLAVYGLAGLPLSVTSAGGTFSNDPLAGDTAPADERSTGHWESQWDTYLTINKDDDVGDATGISGIDDLTTSFSTENGGWFVTPGDPQNLAVDGRVLIAQMTIPCDGGVTGVVNLLFSDFSEAERLSFAFSPTGLRGGGGGSEQVSGDDCNQNCVDDALDVALGYSRDCNGNGAPDECEISSSCLAHDLNCNGADDFGDILMVLANWGPCGVCAADFDHDRSIGFAEVLELLADWGACQ